jgi:hypothetical protein
VHFHPEKPTVVETDASDFALGAMLSQVQKTSKLHPVAYYSQLEDQREGAAIRRIRMD